MCTPRTGIAQRPGRRNRPARASGRLSLGQRQLVEIAKAMSRNAHVIAFDEPTSSLSAREIDR
jgi:L-arabinose transport system ATP-binding protein